MKQIELNNNQVALIDDEDFDRIAQIKWYIFRDGYVRGHLNGKTALMHRLVLDYSGNLDIDHINHNKLDNRKSNLRICNRSQNMANSIDDGYKGVTWHKRAHKWAVYVGYNYKRFYLGLFDNREDAKMAYDRKAKELFGEFA